MFWRRRAVGWLIDPSNVAFGSVVEADGRNLSRSHVRVKYRNERRLHFVPLARFVRSCRDDIRDGQPLGIDHLLVAPILKQRYAGFFDGLTDWGPAIRRVVRRPMRVTRGVSVDP